MSLDLPESNYAQCAKQFRRETVAYDGVAAEGARQLCSASKSEKNRRAQTTHMCTGKDAFAITAIDLYAYVAHVFRSLKWLKAFFQPSCHSFTPRPARLCDGGAKNNTESTT